jgi:lipopolysaccharide biosynthesis glycosyltransferase
MKKIIFFAVAIFLLSLVSASDAVFIATNSVYSFSDYISPQEKAKSVGELEQMMNYNQEKINIAITQVSENKKIAYENQKEIPQAVYCFLSMESLLPAVGILVSDVARQLNDSFQITTSAEENILSRSKITYFLVGGDFNSANKIELEINSNKERISVLRELNLRSNGSQEVQNIFEEQIKNIEDEQARLQEIVNSEKSSKGLFGWIWK